MNGYLAFYNNKKIEIYADCLGDAAEKARTELKVPKSKRGLLSVVLCEKDGEQVTHSTSEV